MIPYNFEDVLIVINIALAAVALGALAYLCEMFVKIKSSPFRYAIQMSILILIFLSPLLITAAHKAEIGLLKVEKPVTPELPASLPIHWQAMLEVPVPEAEVVEKWDVGEWVFYLLVTVWITGTLLYCVHILYGMLRLRRFRKNLEVVKDERSLEALNRAMDYFSLQKAPKLLHAKEVPAPFVMGLRNPSIVLPQDLSQEIGQEQLEAVLLHEVAHIVHKDQWMGLFQRLVLAMFWWCPLLYWINKRINNLREDICDNYVVNVQGSGFRYAQTLVEMAERLLTGRYRYLPATIGLVSSDKKGLTLRINNLLMKERNTMTRMNSLAIWMTGIFFASVTSLTLFSTLNAHDTEAEDKEKKNAERPTRAEDIFKRPKDFSDGFEEMKEELNYLFYGGDKKLYNLKTAVRALKEAGFKEESAKIQKIVDSIVKNRNQEKIEKLRFKSYNMRKAIEHLKEADLHDKAAEIEEKNKAVQEELKKLYKNK